MQVTFQILRGKVSKWRRAMKRLDYSSMLQEVKNHTDITPTNLDVGYDDSENVGIIYAGTEVAGTFSIGSKKSRASAL